MKDKSMDCEELREVIRALSREVTCLELHFVLVDCLGYSVGKKEEGLRTYIPRIRGYYPAIVPDQEILTIEYLSCLVDLI